MNYIRAKEALLIAVRTRVTFENSYLCNFLEKFHLYERVFLMDDIYLAFS